MACTEASTGAALAQLADLYALGTPYAKKLVAGARFDQIAFGKIDRAAIEAYNADLIIVSERGTLAQVCEEPARVAGLLRWSSVRQLRVRVSNWEAKVNHAVTYDDLYAGFQPGGPWCSDPGPQPCGPEQPRAFEGLPDAPKGTQCLTFVTGDRRQAFYFVPTAEGYRLDFSTDLPVAPLDPTDLRLARQYLGWHWKGEY